ncbi:protein TOPAZ1 isoform X1 [Onychostoma macrolepis]|uniref:protein TOPAZ1 isoform X1 n=2 Tax=Onychostoma macrolepis TaxID=369639 RepID=UPI00272C9C47|nr:protein TOPAZ1 isoform X1 [Onychostoma macrolepis]
MLPCSGVSRIKLKRDSFKRNNKLEPNKRRWTGPKTVSGLNPLADRGIQVQDQASSPAPEAAGVVSPERNAKEICATADREPPSQFDGQASSKQDAHAEHDGCGEGYNPGTFPSTVSGFSNCQGGGTKAQSTCSRSQPPSKKMPKRLSEHRKEFFYRLRLALCLKRRNGGKRVLQGPTEVQCHAVSYINSNVSVESDNISIKSTICGESVEQTPPAQLDPKHDQNTGGPDYLGQEKPRAGRGRPRKLFIDHFGGPDGRVKTTIKTDARRARASKARRAIAGRTPNISSKLELRRQLRSDTRKDRKRLVKNSCCALCGDVKYTPPPSKNLAPLLSHRSRADHPSQTVCQKDAGHIAESPTAMNFCFEKYPMVNLCDVARVFDLASRDFSCVLPAVLRQKRKCKRVQCLRKEFDFLVHPHLHGIKECKSKIANQSWEVSTPTHSCASFSSGDPSSGATGSTYVSDTTETPDGSAKEWDACLTRNPDCESMRQTDVEGTDSVLPGCDDNGPVLHFCEKDKACPMTNLSESPTSPARRIPPLILRRVAVNGFGFRGGDGENSGHSLDEEKEEDSSNEDPDGEVNSPESFSCQRVQAYIFFPQSSCARTYKTWPFPRTGPPNQLGSLLDTGPRWIVTTSFPAIVQTSLSGAPVCLSDKDIQNELSKPTKQSKSSDETREVLEGQPLCSFVPGETTLAVLKRTQKGRAQSLNPSCTMTQDSFISRLADHDSCSLESRDVLEQQPSASGEMLPTCTLERTPRGLVHSPKVILTHVSKPAEPESNQSLKKALEDVIESSVPVVTEQVNICKLNGLGYATSLDECGLLKNHCLLKKSNQKVISSGSEIQADFIREEDQKLSKDLSDLEISTHPVSQTSRAQSVEDQEWDDNSDGQTLYNPGSLSEICLKVEMLKARHPSLVTTISAVDQDADSDAPNPATLHTAGSSPDCPGEEKQKQEFDSCAITDSSSEDENEHVTSLLSDDSLEHDAAVSSQSDGDGTSPMNDEEQGSTPQQFPEDADSFLDVSRAYEEDVLVLDVIQDDPELFGAVVNETVSKQDISAEENGKTPPKTEKLQTGNHCKIVWDLNADGSSESCPTAADIKTDSVKDGGSLTVKETENYSAQPVQENSENASDCNNNQEMRQTNGIAVINTTAARLMMDTCSNGYEVTPKETSTLRTLNSNYCWFYFSEYNSCMRSVCWFLHVPRDGDEKFCMDTVKKFCHTGKHALILRAVEVFMGYYSSCSPSVSFSQEIVNSLLSSLLNFCLLGEFEAVINLLLKHKRLPPPEIILAVFKLVMERGLINSVPELIHLTSKIVEAGCVFSVDQCEVMQSHLQMMQVPRQQMDIFLAVKCRALVTNPHTSELSDLAQAVVRVEILKYQEDWAGLALVFCNVCVGSHSQMELLRFCCCVTMALLKEPKGKLTLPYELFAESVCQQVLSNDMIKTILGRIGVSLIFRYHRTRDWNKGVKLVSVMFRLHIEFITLKGLMGNENRVSRCQLVTMAMEFFLHSGSIEGALKMLRADGWFVSSSMWPCEQADIENRKHVLTLLAEKTSHRDTYEILTNLPGIRQPINGVQINEYADTFNAHLRLCLVKQTLPVAADILEFMLLHGMVPETLQLQNLIHKLGKQNNWSRARALFKRAQSAGFYFAVVCERDSLFLPCNLSEIEMTLAFEMFMTFINTKLLAPAGASQPLLITLRRHADIEDVTESVYLAAGCRLLSAALIPNPKLSIRYTAVNKSKEQLFHLDRASAHKWFLQNERWAREIWAS